MDEKTNKILSIDFQWLLAIAPITYEAQCTNHDIVSEYFFLIIMIWRSESVAAHWRTEYHNLFHYNKEFYGSLLTGSHTFQPIIEWKRLLHAYLEMFTIGERSLLLWRRLQTSVSIELMGTLRPYLPGPTFASNQDFQCRPVHGWAKSGLGQAQKWAAMIRNSSVHAILLST